MKHLWRITVSTTPEAEEAVTELLASVFCEPASSYLDAETNVVMVAVYSTNRPTALPEKRTALRAGLLRMTKLGLCPGRPRILIRRIRREDWAESWKRHFKPIEIGDSLLIKPSWSRRRPRKSQEVIVLDPGLSFGTGQHPTTEFCLEQLAKHRRAGQRQSFLDVGTGSGILAIAAAKLGYSPVHAFDFDPEAVRVARANALANDVSGRMKITRANITRLPKRFAGPYDVVCANLISTLLLSERQRLTRLVCSGGVLILAGILKTEFHQVRRAYEQMGLELVAANTKNEWRSGAFV